MVNVITELPIIETQNLTMPRAVRVIVTYTAKVNTGNYSSLETSTMAIIDLPPDTSVNEASREAVNMWRILHEDYGGQFSEIATDSMNAGGWDAIEKQQNHVRPFLIVVKTIWGNIGARLKKQS